MQRLSSSLTSANMSNRETRPDLYDDGDASMSAEATDAGLTSDAASSPRYARFSSIMASSPLDTPTVSGEDDDYRSETSSETTFHYLGLNADSTTGASGVATSAAHGGGGLKRARKQVTSAYSNHRDLSLRLKRAVHNSAENANFGENLVGADVVLCVKSSANRYGDKKSQPGDSATLSPSLLSLPPSCTKKFHAHRFMLAASSEPFRAMLTGHMREASQREVEIYGVEPHVVEKMLLFIYTGGALVKNMSTHGRWAGVMLTSGW